MGDGKIQENHIGNQRLYTPRLVLFPYYGLSDDKEHSHQENQRMDFFVLLFCVLLKKNQCCVFSLGY